MVLAPLSVELFFAIFPTLPSTTIFKISSLRPSDTVILQNYSDSVEKHFNILKSNVVLTDLENVEPTHTPAGLDLDRYLYNNIRMHCKTNHCQRLNMSKATSSKTCQKFFN